MNEEPRSLVLQIIDRYSLEIINDKDRFGNILNDYFQGKYRREKNTLVVALEEGIPGDLVSSNTSIPAAMLTTQLARRLTDNRGISEELAVWTVTTWALALQISVEAPGPVDQPQRIQTVSLTVNTTPPNAKVFVNSQYIGNSPITVTSIPAGSNTIQCQLEGYEAWEKIVDFDPASYTNSITAILVKPASKKAWIFTASNPPGATVYLDGAFQGHTPLSIPDLEPGNHSIKFSLNGYTTWEKTEILQSGQLRNIHANLAKEPDVGAVNVVSHPPGAACYIDSQYQGIVPNNYAGLTVGKHEIRCIFDGLGNLQKKVDIKAGQTLDLTFNFPSTVPRGACDFCHKVQQLPFTCTRCGGQFCTDHRLPENHQCPWLRKKASVSQQSGGHAAPRASQSPPLYTSVPQQPGQRSTPHDASVKMYYAYTAAVCGFLAVVLLIAIGANLFSLVLGIVCLVTAYMAMKERVPPGRQT